MDCPLLTTWRISMPVTSDNPAPYAPSSAILAVVDRHRNKGLPSVVDFEVLARAGVSETLVPRTLHALRTLDLIGEDGRLTDVIEGLRLAPESDYKERMTAWLRSAYADVLTYVDPETATEGQLRDAFRTYKPIGQQGRMVSLFQGLFGAAGAAPERQRLVLKRPAAAVGTRPKTLLRRPPSDKAPTAPASRQASQILQQSDQPAGLPPALAGLLASLPVSGQWTQAERDKFMTAFPVILDYSFEIVAEANLAVANENGG